MEIPWEKILPNGGRLFLSGGASVPYFLVDQLLQRANNFQDVEWMHIHTLGELPWLKPEYRGHFRTNTFFLTSSMWAAVNEGFADYTPCPMSDVPRLFDQGVVLLDLVLIQVSPPNAAGKVSLGVNADVVCSAIRNAKTVVAQVNRHIPKTFGDSEISVEQIDYMVEHDAPLQTLAAWDENSRFEKIGEYAAQLVEDGSTIQASLGDCPQAVLRALLHGHKDLGIHTGCFTDPMMELMKQGVVTNEKKQFQTGIAVATHCLGSQELYDFTDGNSKLEMHSSEWANAPYRISQHQQMVAINGARELDLTGQVVRDSRGHRFYGGIGATQDFIRGAAGSQQGRPIIVLTSTRDQGKTSRIVTGLSFGSGVCTSRGDVHYVVTEFGVANLVGQSIRSRVLRLVEIAHPKFQEKLLQEARSQGWIPQIFGATTAQIHDDIHDIDIKRVVFGDLKYVVRPLHPSDMRSVQEFFYSQNEETIRMRYGFAQPSMDEQTAYRVASVDQTKDLAIGVFYRNNLREDLRAVGRFYIDSSGETAEVAFLVHEKARRTGIAQYLLKEIAEVAHRRGIKKFWASVLKLNVPMARLFVNSHATKKSLLGEDSDEFWMNVADLIDGDTQATDYGLGLYASEKMLAHDTGDHHPESIHRYRVLLDALSKLDLPMVKDRIATINEILLAHSASYHDIAKMDIEGFCDVLRTGDTAVCEDSYTVVMQATGAILNAADQVMDNQMSRVFCAVRPPGHHATEHRGMGFCIFNHVAILARYLQVNKQLNRIAIIDWDVHHGNGTQDLFYHDSSVLFASTHQQGIFPHTGTEDETGEGEGESTTINCTFPIGAGDREIIEAWQSILPKVEAFAPDFIIISAGFDASKEDPVADLQMSPTGFLELTKMVKAVADRVSKGRLISVLEGGYHPESLVQCVMAHLEGLK